MLLSIVIAAQFFAAAFAATPVIVGSLEPEAAGQRSAPAGWVAVLGDCLEERVAGQFEVLSAPDLGSGAAASQVLGAVAGRKDVWVVSSVSVAGAATNPAPVVAELAELRASAAALRSGGVLLLLLPGAAGADAWRAAVQSYPSRGQPPQGQPPVRAGGSKARVRSGASGVDRVWLIDLDAASANVGSASAGNATSGATPALSDQAHARIGALVCDALVAAPALSAAGDDASSVDGNPASALGKEPAHSVDLPAAGDEPTPAGAGVPTSGQP